MIGTLTIRADCSPLIGTGHVMRMIALGQAWTKLGGTVNFVGNTSILNSRLEAEGFTTTPLPDSISQAQDLDILLDSTRENDWIAIDGYQFDHAYQQAVRQANRHTLVLDDVCDRQVYEADILLNQNPDGESYAYQINQDATCLLGTRYTLLRKEFLEASTSQTKTQCVTNVLVTMGGADPDNMTGLVLNDLAEVATNSMQIKIVAGAANPHLESLQSQVQQLGDNWELAIGVNDMPSVINWADAVITAAGSTCWELCYLGIPMAAIQIAKNQQGVLRELSRHEAALCLDGTPEPGRIAEAAKTLFTDQQLRETLKGNAQALIDGKGASRVAKAMYGKTIRLRLARNEDSRLLLDWRNDPTVRARSFNTEPIDFEHHDRWFSAKLDDVNCLFFVAQDHTGQPVGQFRFDLQDGEALVSVSVAPGMTGRGIGSAMTSKACLELSKRVPDAKAVALVKPDNPASASMFLKCGFTQSPTTQEDHLRFVWKREA